MFCTLALKETKLVKSVLYLHLSVCQLRVSDLHGDSDSVRHEVPGDFERGASRSGGQELSRRTQVQHQNI